MDPNETLEAIRAIVSAWNDDDLYDPLGAIDDLASHVSSLDDWLSKGGFLPTVWERK